MNTGSNILVVDDHRMVCDALVALVEKSGLCKKALAAYSGEEALDILHRERIAIALVDARMPGLSGIALVKTIEHDFPLVKIIGMTSYDDTETLHEMLQLKPAGILLKRSTNSSEISTCLEAVRNGKNYFTEEIQQRIQKIQLAPPRLPHTHFTKREIEVIKLLSEGLSSKLIAEQLELKPSTIEDYRKGMLRKTNTQSTAGTGGLCYAQRFTLSFYSLK